MNWDKSLGTTGSDIVTRGTLSLSSTRQDQSQSSRKTTPHERTEARFNRQGFNDHPGKTLCYGISDDGEQDCGTSMCTTMAPDQRSEGRRLLTRSYIRALRRPIWDRVLARLGESTAPRCGNIELAYDFDDAYHRGVVQVCSMVMTTTNQRMHSLGPIMRLPMIFEFANFGAPQEIRAMNATCGAYLIDLS